MGELTKTYSSSNIYKEKPLQNYIIEQLCENHGYIHRTVDPQKKQDATKIYDKKLALDKALVLQFIQSTQQQAWQKLVDYQGELAEQQFFKQLEKVLKSYGTLHVLRTGITLDPAINFSLCYFKPASNINEKLSELYQKNILSVIDELRYSEENARKAIDIVLFVNGIPVVTIECKNITTGSRFYDAEKQYRIDRLPTGEPLLTFKRGALVHFALDQDSVSMTTHLAGKKTRFLPFNRGYNHGAGNPDIDDDYRIAYLYADQPEINAIFSQDILLDIIGQFMHLERKEDGQEKMLFPRFHQLDAVLKILAHAGTQRIGHNYLIQHSAGSGKSNTIAWTAHRLITLHNSNEQSLFDTVIVVTDRRALDQNLQYTIAQFSQTNDQVKKIDGTSRQLREAIQANAKIIVTTINKFSAKHLQEISGQNTRRFAILIDEAHSSQSGKHADNLAHTLTREITEEEDVTSDIIETLIVNHQQQRGPQANISYFAFTATPRRVTLERFGTKGADGLPHAFHLYSMRQAIEEHFILDVLKNYITYQQYYQLEKIAADDPQLQGRKGQRQIRQFVMEHPDTITQKVPIIVEHFRQYVQDELSGHAKAMVVAGSRLQALHYHREIKAYIERQGYTTIKPLIAFSGQITYKGVIYTEASINNFSDKKLPDEFEKNYQLLVVAKKYQTGFNQPRLCAMYVDRKLNDVSAVQTLSRLNRVMPGKQQTSILDFQNTIADIQEAFQPYYAQTKIEDVSDPNQIYQLKASIEAFAIIDESDVEKFCKLFYRPSQQAKDKIFLEKHLQPAVKRFLEKLDEQQREVFRQLLNRYINFYSLVVQIIRLNDVYLEKLFSYAELLVPSLPSREMPSGGEITDDMIRLSAFRIQKKEHGSASLLMKEPSPPQYVSGKKNTDIVTRHITDEKQALSEIIYSFNQKHGTKFSNDDYMKIKSICSEVSLDSEFQKIVYKNHVDLAFKIFYEKCCDKISDNYQKDEQLESIVMIDKQMREQLFSYFFQQMLKQMKTMNK